MFIVTNYQLHINNYTLNITGGLAQLARALAWHARGHRFDPDILHAKGKVSMKFYLFTLLPLKDL